MIDVKNKVIFLTGASGGIGCALVDELIRREVRKIYAIDLKIDNILPLQEKYPNIIVPLELDVTNYAAIYDCQKLCQDTEILINNAGVEFATRFIGNKSIKAAKIEMDVNYHGIHYLCAAFWDSLLQKKSACIINMLSVASIILIPNLATYCASKAAAHFLTLSLRTETLGTNLEIYGVYPGYVDTQMTKNIIDVEKVTPAQIALETCDGLEQGILNIFPDNMAKQYSF